MSRSTHPHSRGELRWQRRLAVARRTRIVLSWHFLASRRPLQDYLREERNYILRSADTPCTCRHICCANARHKQHYQTKVEDLAVMAHWEQLIQLGREDLMRPTRMRGCWHLRRNLHRLAR